jgi:hypothetical protein
VLYKIPGMRSVPTTDDSFIGADGQPLPIRVYEAIRPRTDTTASPIVVLVEGYPSAGFQKHMGCTFMEMEWTISMAQLVAASGVTAVTHSNRDPPPDARALLRHLGAGGRRVGIWAVSGHGPVALEAAASATCAVLINPVTKDFYPETPLYIARAGKDETPGLNVALDALMARAIAENRPISVVNHADAPHAFDLCHASEMTRFVLQQGLAFLRLYLRA